MPSKEVSERTTPEDGELTPNGGDYAIAYFFTTDGVPCEKSKAEKVEIVEYEFVEDDDLPDVVVGRTYGTIE